MTVRCWIWLVLGSTGCSLLEARPLVKADRPDSGAPAPCAESTWFADVDGDRWGDPATAVTACDAPDGSWVRTAGDCDDTDARVVPGSVELCDGVDNDCDGATDEDDAADARVWYVDADADGHGSTVEGGRTCAELPPGAWSTDDCDDADPTAAPGTPEVCDGVDNDCDTLVDGDDPDVDLSTATTWHADTDTDGHGDPTTATVACAAPSGFVADGTDCDDTTAAVSPSATEVCDDGIDNDCDGTRNSCGLSGEVGAATASAVVEAESANDRFGQSLSTRGDFDGDGFADLLVGAEDTEYSGVSNSGSVFVEFGPFSGGSAAGPGARFDGDTDNGFVGQSVVATGDLSGDGFADFVVTADDASTSPQNAGVAYVTLGPISRGQERSLAESLAWTGTGISDYAGSGVAAGLDVDADGTADLLVGARGADGGLGPGAEVYLLRGPITSGGSLADADHTWAGLAAFDGFGGAVAALGDVDGDGFDDFAVGAARHSDTASEQGAVFVFAGPLSVVPTSADAAVWLGAVTDDALGSSVAPTGDVDGDGLDDFVAGIPGDDTGASDAGALALVTTAASSGGAISSAAAVFRSTGAGSRAGGDAASAADLDGDGAVDLLVGVWQEATSGSNAGRAYLFYGPFSGVRDLSDADFQVAPEQANDWLGEAVSLTDDLTGDGQRDVVVGARHGGTGGSVYVFEGIGG